MAKTAKSQAKEEQEVLPVCGLVMPISAMDGYSQQHWVDVQKFIVEALSDTHSVRLVSMADEITVIHGTIVQNLRDNPIVICDVSGRNPNVMFEFGMRVGFDMLTIPIMDSQTRFTFDTAPLEHILYPADLHYFGMGEFRDRLKRAVKSATERKSASPFLSHFQRTRAEALADTSRELADTLDQILTGIDRIESKQRTNQINQTVPPASWQNVVLQPTPQPNYAASFGLNSNQPDLSKLYGFDKKPDPRPHPGKGS